MAHKVEAKDRFRGCLLGLAAGDAVGTTVEFKLRGSFTPVTDMTGGGPFNLEPGEWTDDTSMALCLAMSLLKTNRFDPEDQMERYVRWRDEGYLASNGRCFDIGVTSALRTYQRTGQTYSGPTREYSAGNGSIMRLAPVPMFYMPDTDRAARYAAESSRATHGAAECIDACRLFGRLLAQTLSGEASKEKVLSVGEAEDISSPSIRKIARGTYRQKERRDVEGSGYVVKSLEAALWCFWRTDSFETAILEAANLGDDADTTAAVCGQIAGAFYGATGIPEKWLNKLARREEITVLADRLHRVKR